MRITTLIMITIGVISVAASASLADIAQAPNGIKPAPIAGPSVEQTVRASGFKYEVLDAARFHPGAIRINLELLHQIVFWLSINFDLPQIHDYPNIAFVSASKMGLLRYKDFYSGAPDDIVLKDERGPQNARKIVAVYDDKLQTIYLPEGWTGATPIEISVLVHEMVHHLQNVGHLKHECLAARETLAYAAQALWLDLFGLNLAREFELDDFDLLVRTRCIY
jgi:hypothetical protein